MARSTHWRRSVERFRLRANVSARSKPRLCASCAIRRDATNSSPSSTMCANKGSSQPGFIRRQELSCLIVDRLACSFEGADERFLRELFNDRFNGPSQSKWYVARQRNGSAFDDHAGITFLQSPVGIQAP